MAIRFVLGRAGSGKTHLCLNEVRQRLIREPDGPPLILLVPEQATFQAEYALVSTPELSGMIRAQALSFRRLAWRVMQEAGGTARVPIDEVGKKLLLHKILHKHQERLQLFHTGLEQMGFADKLNELLTELKRYCMTADGLERHLAAAEKAGKGVGGLLRSKLHDLQLIYRDFEDEMARQYLDGEDVLSLLAKQLETSSFVRSAEFWVDGFHGFTPQEMAVLEKLMEVSANVTVTLCLDREVAAGEQLDELDLFHPTARTCAALQEAAARAGLPKPEVVLLSGEPAPRYRESPMLGHLEKHFEHRLSKGAYAYAGAGGEDIRICAAVHRRAEVEGAAREMLRLAREEGVRWREMAVMVRSMEGYHDLIATVFADYGIPHFFDQKRSVLHHPLVEFLRSAVEVVLHNWHYDAVFRCVKTGLLLPLPEDNDLPWDLETLSGGMDRLENAALAYGIHGYRWTDGKPWTFRTKVSLEEEDGGPAEIMEEELKLINGCRQLVAKPLHAFQERMRKAVDVKERTQAFMELLLELRVPEKLERWSEECLQAGAPEKAREHAQVWDSVIDMFDQLVEILGEEPVSLELYGALLETGLESIKLGLVPPSLDQVLIGSMDRTRSGQIRYAFLLGVSDGVVPAKMNEDGLLTEQERETLAGAGLPLAEGSRRKLLDEQFIAYSALCSPSRRLWISYPLADEEGKSLLPSELVHQLLHLFPGLQERLILAEPSPVLPEEEQAEFIAHPDKALAYLGVQLKQWLRGERIPELWWTVYDWFARRPEWESKLKLLVTALFYTNKENPLTVPTSRSIYGDRLQASVSRMERYAACPFSHFISHGLKLQERKVYRLEAPDIGQLFHAALHQFVRQLQEERVDWGALTAEESYARTSQLVDRLAPQLQGEILLSSSRFGYISRKLKAAVGKAAVMLTEHARRGEFVPLGLEVDFGPGGPLPPLTFRLYNGCMMDIIGRIDRVDGAGGDGKLLLRVIDYKSGPTSLQLPEVYYGLSLQMLTYLDVLVTHSKRWLGAEAVPAGVLYFHVHNPLLQQKNRPDPGEAEAQLRKRFKMRGLVTADAEIARKMDGGLREKNGYSELIPVAVKADGSFYKSSSVVTEGQWDRLREFVRGQIKRIGTGITDGQVDIAPYRLGKKAACRHCNYRAVCQFDPQFEGNGYKLLVPLGKEEVWSELEKTASDSAAIER